MKHLINLKHIFNIVESGPGNEDKKTIALIPGSFKPPTAGHLDMAIKYAKIADEVYIIISDPKTSSAIRKTKTGKIITGADSKTIWEIYIKRYNLKNVKVQVSEVPSPIVGAFKFIEQNLKDVNVILGSSKKDDYDIGWKKIMEYYSDKLPGITILDVREYAVAPFIVHGKPISATDIRTNIDNIAELKGIMPDKLTSFDIDTIQKILI